MKFIREIIQYDQIVESKTKRIIKHNVILISNLIFWREEEI